MLASNHDSPPYSGLARQTKTSAGSRSPRRHVGVWTNGGRFRPCMDHEKLCVLASIGAGDTGRKELLASDDGFREIARCLRKSADLHGFANPMNGLLTIHGKRCCSACATRTVSKTTQNRRSVMVCWVFESIARVQANHRQANRPDSKDVQRAQCHAQIRAGQGQNGPT